jgi:hypothetical protein
VRSAAREPHDAQALQALPAARLAREAPEDRGAGVVDGDALFTEPSLQRRESFGAEIDGMQARAVQQRVERGVRRLCHGPRAEQGHAVVTAELQGPGVAKDVEEEIPLAVQDPLRTPGRSGRVEDARRCVGPDLRRDRACEREAIDVDALHAERPARRRPTVVAQHESRSAVFENMGEPRAGMRGVEEDEELPRLEDPEQRGDATRVARREHRHGLASLSQSLQHRTGDGLGPAVELLVGHAPRRGSNGVASGAPPGLLSKALGDRPLGRRQGEILAGRAGLDLHPAHRSPFDEFPPGAHQRGIEGLEELQRDEVRGRAVAEHVVAHDRRERRDGDGARASDRARSRGSASRRMPVAMPWR